jgi:hypothetical protein
MVSGFNIEREKVGNIPSMYALYVKYPIKPMSARKIIQEKKVHRIKRRCRMNIALKSNEDCHAWNLNLALANALNRIHDLDAGSTRNDREPGISYLT